MSSRNEPPRAATLAVIIARECSDARPHLVALAVQAMQRAAKAHKADAVTACNYARTERQEARADKRLARLAEEAAEALSDCGEQRAALSLDFGGDPRGPCGRLIVAGMPGDGWGDGFAIHD